MGNGENGKTKEKERRKKILGIEREWIAVKKLWLQLEFCEC